MISYEYAEAWIPDAAPRRYRRRMIFSDLLTSVPDARIVGDPAVEIAGLHYDSREVGPGTLFVAVPGERADGHAFAVQAFEKGASALVVERELSVPLPQGVVPAVRPILGALATTFFGRPSESMVVVGVTGTNGKTTTTFMLERCLAAAGHTTGLLGTVEVHIGAETAPVVRTTPEAIDLQRTLALMRDSGVTAVAMEASSHGLELGRVNGTVFACGVFTNLTQDHLDFHGTMERYYRAKARLFNEGLAARAVINLDDEFGRRLAASLRRPLVTYAIGQPADVVARDLRLSRRGTTFRCVTPVGSADVDVPIPGRFNVENALAAVATCVALELPIESAVKGIAALEGVPGRIESIREGQPFGVFVDYAHTPDSLERVLKATREVCGGRLVVVFGCGGDRDRAKRPLMGEIAAKLADHAIITSDNPRSESPERIIAQIEAGARSAGGAYEIEVDRRAAIVRAIARAEDGDVIVIAGKGHETGQQFADHTIPFDDRIVTREELRRWSR